MMQSFVSNVRDSILLFGVGSLITFSSYFVMNYYLNIYSGSYRDIPDDRKFYVLANLIKSGLLAIYTPHCIEMLFYLNNLGRIGADKSDNTQRNISNGKFIDYKLSNYFSDTDSHVSFATKNKNIHFKNSLGGLSGKVIDYDSMLTIKKENKEAEE